MRFSELVFTPHPMHADGVQSVVMFPNGYGASVVRFTLDFGNGFKGGSYGADSGLYELAVLQKEGESFEICYTTPVTDDVLGYLTEDDVTRVLTEIEALPKEPMFKHIKG